MKQFLFSLLSALLLPIAAVQAQSASNAHAPGKSSRLWMPASSECRSGFAAHAQTDCSTNIGSWVKKNRGPRGLDPGSSQRLEFNKNQSIKPTTNSHPSSFCGAKAPQRALEVNNLPRIARHSKGRALLYQDIQTAINNCAPGDTVFVPEGEFESFTINRSGIAIIGCGNSSVIKGDFIFGNLKDIVIESLYFESIQTDINTDMENVWIRNCANSSFHPVISDNNAQEFGRMKNVFFERCYMGVVLFSDYHDNSEASHDVTFQNCRLWGLLNCALTFDIPDLVFNNCTIESILSLGYNGGNGQTFTFFPPAYYSNCQIFQSEPWENLIYVSPDSNSIFVNSMLRADEGNYSMENCIDCWMATEKDFSDFNSQTDLIAAGYICPDGTPVGCYGGATPLTFSRPLLPVVTEPRINTDFLTKKAKIDLNIKTAYGEN